MGAAILIPKFLRKPQCIRWSCKKQNGCPMPPLMCIHGLYRNRLFPAFGRYFFLVIPLHWKNGRLRQYLINDLGRGLTEKITWLPQQNVLLIAQ